MTRILYSEISKMSFAMLIVGATWGVSEALAEDAPQGPKISPEVYKVIAENDQMVVVEATWKPGQKDKQHSHYGDRASIFLTDCKLRFFSPDGKQRDSNPKAGKARVRSGEPVSSHSAQNIGDKVCKILLVEIKK